MFLFPIAMGEREKGQGEERRERERERQIETEVGSARKNLSFNGVSLSSLPFIFSP